MTGNKIKYTKIHFDIIRDFFYARSKTSSDLSKTLEKSVPSINKALNELIEAGYVEENGLAPSSGGRRPLTYNLNRTKNYITVIAMDQLSTRIGIIDLHNSYAHPIKSIEIDLINDPDALKVLLASIEEYLTESKIPKSQILGMGMGMPGFVDAFKGINFTYLNPEHGTLTEYIYEKTGLKAYIDNDSSLVALAEYKFGKATLGKEVMVINLGWGIGLGMIVKGELFRGYSGFAGEFSHIPITEKEILCSCGKQGCLEAVASLLAVTNKAIEGINNGKATSLKYPANYHSKVELGNAIIDAANKGDQYAVELIADSAYNIGRALAILIHIMNPQTIILSGRTVQAGMIMLAPIQQALNKHCIPRLFSNTEIKLSDLGFDAELIGASILVLDNLESLIENQ